MGRPLSLQASLPGLGRLARRFWPYLRRERPLIAVSLLALYAEGSSSRNPISAYNASAR